MGSTSRFDNSECGDGAGDRCSTPDLVFPVELNSQLRHRLEAEIQENCKLRRFIESQEEQIKTLSKSNHELLATSKMVSENGLSFQSPQVAAKVVELKKRNRDMATQMESMKSKMQQLLNENSELKHRVHELEVNAPAGGGAAVSEGSNTKESSTGLHSDKSTEDILSAAQQLSQTTHKMMEYRRMCQQLRLDHRAALRALCQEIGDGVSPKNVLSVVTAPSWRGRQQQILTLTQKVNELQAKLTHAHALAQQKSEKFEVVNNWKVNEDQDDDSVAMDKTYSIHGENESVGGGDNVGSVRTGIPGGNSYDYRREIQLERMNRDGSHQQKDVAAAQMSPSLTHTSAIFSASHRHLLELQLQDKKKHEQMENLRKEVEDYKSKVQHYHQEKKAIKARMATLENQVRSLRCEIDEIERKLKEKTQENHENSNELGQVRDELQTVRNRERQLRESNSLELHEAKQSLTRERQLTIKLQAMLNERQDLVQKMEADIKRLQSNLDLCCGSAEITSARGSSRAALDIAAKINQLKTEVQHTAKVVDEYEKERQDLLTFTRKLIEDVEAERELHSVTQQKLAKSFTVLDQTNDCLSICLDESQITCRSILSHVEAVRSLIREIKTVGDLYSMDLIPIDEIQKLKARIGLLSKENRILHQQASRSLTERRRDLEQYGNFATKLRNEFLVVLHAATNSFSKHVE